MMVHHDDDDNDHDDDDYCYYDYYDDSPYYCLASPWFLSFPISRPLNAQGLAHDPPNYGYRHQGSSC